MPSDAIERALPVPRGALPTLARGRARHRVAADGEARGGLGKGVARIRR
jgi:hypothetical protein